MKQAKKLLADYINATDAEIRQANDGAGRRESRRAT